MRAVVLSERLAPPPDEGIKKLTLSLAAALRDSGHDVRLLTTGGTDWPEMGLTNVPADRLLRSAELAATLRSFRPAAVIYVPTASLTLASAARARALKRYAGGAPVALLAAQGRRHNWAVRLTARLLAPDLCAVQSAGTLAQARALGWRTVHLPPGVDLATFRPVSPAAKAQVRAKHGLPMDTPVVLHAGHLNPSRGVLDLAAIADLACPVLAASTSTAAGRGAGRRAGCGRRAAVQPAICRANRGTVPGRGRLPVSGPRMTRSRRAAWTCRCRCSKPPPVTCRSLPPVSARCRSCARTRSGGEHSTMTRAELRRAVTT
jgi:hypothetical protein